MIMDKKSGIGVCYCPETNGHPDSFDPTTFVAFSESLSKIKQVWNKLCLQITPPKAFALSIQNAQLDRIVIAGKNLRFMKSLFPRAMVMFYRTLPSPDITACIITPKLTHVDQRLSIELLT